MLDNCLVRKWFFLSGAVVAEVTGTLALKGALDSPALYILVAAGYAAAFVFLSLTLRAGMALGIAYGIWGATGVALTAVLSLVFFGEPLTPVMITGIVFIMAGVILVEIGNREDDAHSTEQEIHAGEHHTRWDEPPADESQSPADEGDSPARPDEWEDEL